MLGAKQEGWEGVTQGTERRMRILGEIERKERNWLFDERSNETKKY